MNNILTDLDDFLAPSQECIKMIVPDKSAGQRMQPGGGEGNASDQSNANRALVMLGNDLEDEDAFKVEINPGTRM